MLKFETKEITYEGYSNESRKYSWDQEININDIKKTHTKKARNFSCFLSVLIVKCKQKKTKGEKINVFKKIRITRIQIIC